MPIRTTMALAAAMLAACNLPTRDDASRGSTSGFSLPVPESFALSNGLQVWLLPSRQIPLVNMSLVLRTGSSQDPDGKEGLTALVADMLDEGSGSRTAPEVADAVDQLGAELGIEVQKEHVEVSIEVLKRNLDAALEIFADVILRPRFETKDWERIHELALNDLAQRREEARDVARVVSERVFYGDEHPFGHPVDGYEGALKSITLDDARSFHRACARPENAVLLVVGDVSASDLQPRLDRLLGAWRGSAEPLRPVAAPAVQPSGTRLIVVDKPDAPQTEFRILLAGPAFGDASAPPLSLANTILGGTFTSRLVTNLRERNGFTYGASSQVLARRTPGHVVLGSAIATPRTGAALVEFWRELVAMETGKFEPDELQKSRSTHRSRFIEALETQDTMVKLYLASAAMDALPDERRGYLEKLLEAGDDAIAAAARGIYRWDAATIVLVGDAKAIASQLEEIARTPPAPIGGRALVLPAVERRGRDGERI